jgi:hypothetical protein
MILHKFCILFFINTSAGEKFPTTKVLVKLVQSLATVSSVNHAHLQERSVY